jgi:uncharacterized protein (DUF305 family)
MKEQAMRILGPVQIVILAASLAAPAFAQQATTAPHQMAAMSMSGGASPADKAMMAGMSKMQQEMAAVPLTGDADKDFVAMMLPHHWGAVDMAKVELQYGKDPEMRRLARSIISGQDQQRAQMMAWQARHPSK